MSTTSDAVASRRPAIGRRRRQRATTRGSGQALLHVSFIIACLATLFPLVWMLRTAFSLPQEVFRPTLSPWPDNATMSNFAAAFRLHPVGTWFLNSVAVAAAITTFVVAAGAMVQVLIVRPQVTPIADPKNSQGEALVPTLVPQPVSAGEPGPSALPQTQ